MNILKRILILCEDSKSSLSYFKSFKNDEKYKRNLSSVDIKIYQPRDYSPKGLVKEAINELKSSEKEKNKYDDIWIVFDKDKHDNIPEAFDLAYKKNIKIALSVICFEFWILLHFEKTMKSFKDSDEIISYIKDKHFDYKKCENCFDEVKDKMQIAINNGEWVIKQVQNDLDRGTKKYQLSAYTDVHKLVSILINPN